MNATDRIRARLDKHLSRNEGTAMSPVDTLATAKPDALLIVPASRTIVADVREELRAGREPFSLIMEARAAVPADGALCVRATFEPVPLYAVMQRQGLSHWTEKHDDDDWAVWFYREPDVVVLDVRGLEPPEPMVRTLAALEQLAPGHTLLQINTRVPQFLLPVLEERGFTHEVLERDADVVKLFIRRIRNTDAAH